LTADTPEQLLFVYGSLKRGQVNHAQLGRAVFVGLARTQPLFALRMIEGYPALVPGQRAVRGELYRIAEGDLARVDEFEGTNYRRRAIELEAGAPALAYLAISPAAGDPYPADEWPEA
jgi:gamma-glutamylcyclotransferase (GGCT)/AIG2-like uncharacterized protein YtfP